MSHREGRDSDSRRHRSRFDREPSPKRSRRDGKPETERVVANSDVGDQDEKQQRRRLQDALPLEAPAPSAPDSSKIETGSLNKESDRKNNEHQEAAKHSSDPTQVPRSRSYFQHDERGNAAQAGRSFGRRAATERGWWRDADDQHNDKETKAYETRQRNEKPQGEVDRNGEWRHDRFFEMEAEPPLQPQPSARKRPAFSEKKISTTTQSTDNATKEPEKESHSVSRVVGSERRVERDHNSRHLDRQDRTTAGDHVPNKREAPRGGFSSHERHGGGGGGGGGGNFRGRDRFSGRQGYRSGGTRVEKWKHDLFDEANKSPPRKNEEDQIAKVEALLAS